MDKQKLHSAATALSDLLSRYAATDDEVRQLASSIGKLIEQAQAERIATPMEWRDVPGGYYFTEGQLRKFADLEGAFAVFRLELTGGEIPIAR